MAILTDYQNLAADLRDQATELPSSLEEQLLTEVASVTARVQREYQELVSSHCIAQLTEQSFQALLRQQQSLSIRRLVTITLWVDKEIKECSNPASPSDCPDSPAFATPLGAALPELPLLALTASTSDVSRKLEARADRLSEARAEEKTESKMALSKSSSKVYIDIKPLDGTVSLPTEPADLAAQLSSPGWDLLFGTNRLQKWVSVTGAISRVVRQTVARA